MRDCGSIAQECPQQRERGGVGPRSSRDGQNLPPQITPMKMRALFKVSEETGPLGAGIPWPS